MVKRAKHGQCSMHRHFLSKARLAGQRLHSPTQHTPLLSLPVSMWCQFPKKRWQLLCWLLPAGQRPGPNRNRGPPRTQQQPLTVFLPRHPIHHPPLPPAIPFLLSSLTSPPLFVFLLDTGAAHWRRIKTETSSPSLSIVEALTAPPPLPPPFAKHSHLVPG